MAPLIYRAILLAALGTCLVSFFGGMRNAFVLPRRATSGMKITAISGTFFALLHFCVILASTNVWAPRVFAAVLLYLSALSLFWWTVIITGRRRLPACFTRIEPSILVTDGQYRLVRHPFYTSYLIAWGAGTLATLNPWLLFTSLAMCTLYIFAARAEEKALLKGVHSAEYLDYCNRTGMFFTWRRRKRNAV